MADEDAGIGFLYSGWCQAALPHARLANDKGWQIDGERVRLIVEPGMRGGAHGEPEPVGVPYGSRARLILLRLQSEALRTQSRDVELGRNLNDWLIKMGIPSEAAASRTSRIRPSASAVAVSHSRSGTAIESVWRTRTSWNRPFFSRAPTHYKAHCSLSMHACRKLSSYRCKSTLCRSRRPPSARLLTTRWRSTYMRGLPTGCTSCQNPSRSHGSALKQQFGISFSRIDNFKTTFCSNLRLALAVYRDAKVDDEAGGLILYPSRPPVAPLANSPLLVNPKRKR